jgi:type I restriction enzyme S subunit
MYNLRNQKIDFDFQPQYIKEEVHNGKLQRSRTEIGDLIMNIVGPPLGKLAIIPHSLPQANFNQAAVLIRPLQHKEVLVKYLFYYLSEMTEINSISTKGSAGQVNISLTQSQNMRIPFPPLAEQKRIVAEIERWFVLVDQIDKGMVDLQTTIKQTKSKILDLAIHGKLVPQDPNDEPASVLLERIKEEKAKLFKECKLKKKDLVDSVIFKCEDNKYYETIDGKTECIDERIPFELPHNWCWATLGNLVQNCSGLAYKKENLDERSTSYIRVLRGGNIDDGQWTMKDDDVMIATKFVKPELLLTAGTFITPAVTSIEQMGKTALVRDDQPQTVVGGFVLMLLPFLRDWSLLDYLELIFQSEYYKGYCRSITNKSGQAFYNLSRQKLMQFLVPLPPLNERIAIANEVAKINSMMR